jgi:hypothetical protein
MDFQDGLQDGAENMGPGVEDGSNLACEMVAKCTSGKETGAH